MKQIFATLMIFISSLIFTIPASAEFRLGAMAGTSSLAAGFTGDLAGFGGTDRIGSGGVFGQWRGSTSDTVDLGIHLGYSADSASDEETVGTVTVGIESDGTLDLMGIIVWTDGKVKPFIMAGLSAYQIESYATGTVIGNTDDSATGLKVAIGMEWPVAENWNGHAMIDYADYGEIELFDLDVLQLETQQTGIKLGIAYSF